MPMNPITAIAAFGVPEQQVDALMDVLFQDWEKGLDLNELARHHRTSDTTVSLLWFSDEDLPEVEVNRFGVREVDDGGLAELTGELPWPGKNRKR